MAKSSKFFDILGGKTHEIYKLPSFLSSSNSAYIFDWEIFENFCILYDMLKISALIFVQELNIVSKTIALYIADM